jgi:hypothetical protein
VSSTYGILNNPALLTIPCFAAHRSDRKKPLPGAGSALRYEFELPPLELVQPAAEAPAHGLEQIAAPLRDRPETLQRPSAVKSERESDWAFAAVWSLGEQSAEFGEELIGRHLLVGFGLTNHARWFRRWRRRGREPSGTRVKLREQPRGQRGISPRATIARYGPCAQQLTLRSRCPAMAAVSGAGGLSATQPWPSKASVACGQLASRTVHSHQSCLLQAFTVSAM